MHVLNHTMTHLSQALWSGPQLSIDQAGAGSAAAGVTRVARSHAVLNRRSMITVTDLFAGADGSSTGATQGAWCVALRAASNHWQLAVDVRSENNRSTDHICADVSQISPRYFPQTEMLWASPECTNHSRAKGRKAATAQPDLFGETSQEVAERSRATMWERPVQRVLSVLPCDCGERGRGCAVVAVPGVLLPWNLSAMSTTPSISTRCTPRSSACPPRSRGTGSM